MITVTYYRKYNRLTVEGHARSGEPGHDLVCASASILVYTLAANVEHLAGLGHARIESMALHSGNAEIGCKVRGGARAVVASVFEAICVGFELLARDYPQYVSYEIHD